MNNTTGEAEKSAGISTVLGNNIQWKTDCYAAFPEFKLQFLNLTPALFTAEAMRQFLTTKAGKPKHPNAWGALTNAFARKGLIVKSGNHVHAKDILSHACEVPLWQFA